MNGRAWTETDDQVLRERYPDERASDLVAALKRSLTSIHARAQKLGIEKSQAFRQSEKSGQILRGRTNPNMVATQIQKGAKPWNKGIKGSCGLHPNCKATQFRKGHLQGRAAQVVQPIGAERLTKDGILQRKVNNDLPFQRRWKSVHSVVWEAAHGPIPPGHKVVFLPGQFTSVAAQITAEKLELVTHAELMRRNSYHTRYPKELGLVIQMRGQLNRKINRLTKEIAGEE